MQNMQLRHLTCLLCSSFYHGTDQHPRVCSVITGPYPNTVASYFFVPFCHHDGCDSEGSCVSKGSWLAFVGILGKIFGNMINYICVCFLCSRQLVNFYPYSHNLHSLCITRIQFLHESCTYFSNVRVSHQSRPLFICFWYLGEQEFTVFSN